MNNDEIVNNFDIDPFVMAISDPAAYDAAFPGLTDSMIYHADANADGVANNFDIGPFVERVSALCCSELYPCVAGSCGPLAAQSAPQTPMTPADTAEILASGVSVAWRVPLEHAIAELAANSSRSESAYWSEVLREIDLRR
ncbi:MAG: hypothetical protein JNG88_00490 [Phycisphaerales bacterium]|nr:hypothetical protein [Phycisphaerales bacterium]